jgi:hypothetical protein
MMSMLVVALLAVSSFAAPNSSGHRGVDLKRADGDPEIPSGWTALGCYTYVSGFTISIFLRHLEHSVPKLTLLT